MSRFSTPLISFLLLATLAGCSGGGIFSPDVDHNSPNARSAKYRTVFRGDTLFSIAWDIGVDFRTLASWNGIRSPYVIKPGQRLLVSGDQDADGKARDTEGRSTGRSREHYYRVKKGDTVFSIARKTGNRSRNIIRWNRLRKPYRIQVGQRLRISSATTQVASRRPTRSNKSNKSRRTEPTATRPKSVGRWVWPTQGKILRRYSPYGASKGVDIGGSAGQAIHAAAGGHVVYQGSGLRGYGKLIIIKHNSDFLSAYAHCSTILVKEGSRVKRGQQIAKMGSTGSKSVKLHFEIRLRGNPVDPLRYLPPMS